MTMRSTPTIPWTYVYSAENNYVHARAVDTKLFQIFMNWSKDASAQIFEN